MVCPNWKRDPLYSFWSRAFPRIFIWSQVYHHYWPSTLKSIFSRSIVTCPSRIIKFFPSIAEVWYRAILVPDTLSWSYLNNIKPESDENQFWQTVICHTINGWPEKHQIPRELSPYYSHHSEITYHKMSYHPPLRNEVDYLWRNFLTWKFGKTCPSSSVLAIN